MRQFYILLDWFFWNTAPIWIAAGVSIAITLVFHHKKSKKLTRIAQSVTIAIVLVGVSFGFYNTTLMTRCENCNEPLYKGEYYTRCPECRTIIKLTREFDDKAALPGEAWKWQDNE